VRNNKKGAEETGAPKRACCNGLVTIVVVIIPIALIVPAMAILIPPAVRVFPAIGARFGEFVAPAFRLRAWPAVVLDGFVKSVVCVCDASLTVVIRLCSRCRDKQGSGESQAQETAAEHLRFQVHSFSQCEIWMFPLG